MKLIKTSILFVANLYNTNVNTSGQKAKGIGQSPETFISYVLFFMDT
jgi:hypothetical protein